MSEPGSLLWFARHELRLAWRDAMSMMTAGRPGRERRALIGVVVFIAFLHFIAFMLLSHLGTLSFSNDLPTLITITAGVVLTGSAMVSQAMESVTRSFYSRSDLELILSSPAHANRLFAVRIGAIALFVGAASLFFIGPFVDVLAWEAGPRWLAAYGLILSVSLLATALGVVITVGLFHVFGPRRTRLVAQICAAAIGAVFVIGLQIGAMFSIGTISRMAFLRSAYLIQRVPEVGSIFWRPAEAALGDGWALAAILIVSFAFFIGTTILVAPQFQSFAIAAWGAARAQRNEPAIARPFRVRTPSAALRRKEILLILRDPWLISQSLMQLLYLLPPALLLWRSFATGAGAALILVPVLIMAAGQLSGGLAWLTISGEDAPDLVLSAPITSRRMWRAKTEAVMESVGIVFAPFVAGLALVSPTLALIAAVGILASAASAAAIQFWFRSQAKRSNFRRRHTSSRIATFSEAFSSIAWAGTGAVAAAGSWLAGFVAIVALGIVGIVRLISPARTQAKAA